MCGRHSTVHLSAHLPMEVENVETVARGTALVKRPMALHLYVCLLVCHDRQRAPLEVHCNVVDELSKTNINSYCARRRHRELFSHLQTEEHRCSHENNVRWPATLGLMILF